MSSTLERIKKLEESMEQVVNKITSPDPMLQMTMNKTIGIEQSVAAMGKTLAAVTEELSETGVLNSASVMARLRKAEDQSARDNIKALFTQNIIEESEVVDEASLVAVEQKILNTETGESTVISSYNLVGMRSPITNPVWKDSLLGKTVGDTVKGVDGTSEQEILTVLEVWAVQEREVEGEPQVPPQTETDSVAEDTDTDTDNEADGSDEEISFDSEDTDTAQPGA